jgi:hypothetical protein
VQLWPQKKLIYLLLWATIGRFHIVELLNECRPKVTFVSRKNPQAQTPEESEAPRYEGKVRLEKAELARARAYCFNHDVKMQELLHRATIEFLDRGEAKSAAVFSPEEAKLAREFLALVQNQGTSEYAYKLLKDFPDPDDAALAKRFLVWLKRAQANANFRHVAEMVLKLMDIS